ncbi:hypothetical protein GMW39_10520 [Pectobacterium parmentieri]|uniref:Uncharacterized protein n=1 Tax=Pectobacterium quasiaquaticum TaxID=2774015 RepID=A0A9Q2ENT3_9GAMM|nr:MULTISPECIES: hypothetical protein [Pectobacterium]MBE5213263.1 hypothetical protein [Pectobacterium quasiaquaticum]MBE5221616.1 hypothetical protein [Pectobacterium quasiaquaticum]MBE5224087.1 hypothetical protein [Pectobacterium quasiaquaticum]QHQ16261.1 hypothetical protein GMW39_10520 [Pectobacterium parmentieri]URG50611.1 hypothetical protein IG609_008985 [Pectobacterium quasiaquaticum]
MLKGINALDKWLDRSTWLTGHDLDLEVFFHAVKEIIAQNPETVLHEAEIAAYIKSSQSGKIETSELERLAKEYSQKAELISDYVRLTK